MIALWLLPRHRVNHRQTVAHERQPSTPATGTLRKIARKTCDFRDLLVARRQLARARQFIGGSRRSRRAPHVSNQHRPSAHLDACRVRLRVPHVLRRDRSARADIRDAPPSPPYRGHFYNWYDTRTLAPLVPSYVSTVDSGNLAGYLLTLRTGLYEPSTMRQLSTAGFSRASRTPSPCAKRRWRARPADGVRLRSRVQEGAREIASSSRAAGLARRVACCSGAAGRSHIGHWRARAANRGRERGAR